MAAPAPVQPVSYEKFMPEMVKLAEGNVGAGSILAEICHLALQNDPSGQGLSNFSQIVLQKNCLVQVCLTSLKKSLEKVVK